jgi:hypothetical protein
LDHPAMQELLQQHQQHQQLHSLLGMSAFYPGHAGAARPAASGDSAGTGSY